MAAKVWPPLLPLVFLFILSISSELNSPQNIGTFFPLQTSPVIPEPSIPTNSPASMAPSNSQTSSSSSTSGSTIAKAVGITVASGIVLAGKFFSFLKKSTASRHRPRLDKKNSGSWVILQEQDMLPRYEFNRFDGNLNVLIVDENGVDVLYWRMLEDQHDGEGENEEEEVGYHGGRGRKSGPIQEIRLLGGKFLNSPSRIFPHGEGENPPEHGASAPSASAPPLPPPPPANPAKKKGPPAHPPPPIPVKKGPPAPPLPPMPLKKGPPPIPVEKGPSVSPPPAVKKDLPAPPPPPIRVKKGPPAPPPPPIPVKKGPPAPPPPPIPGKKDPLVPPPPPTPVIKGPPAPPPLQIPVTKGQPAPPPPPIPVKKGPLAPPTPPYSGASSDLIKLKPFHWDKVTIDLNDSVVWHKINNGSFSFDSDLMEALFGYAATNQKTPLKNRDSSNVGNSNCGSPAKVFILDPRKSQNTAIVLKSLAMSRQEIIEALLEDRGLNADTLEKLNKIAPTQEEETQIRKFSGDSTKLADAESFLFQILKAVPSAFTRLDALLFRSNYDHEIQQVKESLQTLESACKELQNRGLFLELLEAVLKAGNRMNAGTTRGEARAFNLTALLKLSDVKSTDGKTTLLHFVVEAVARFEGKRCLINRNHSHSSINSVESARAKEEREREYVKLGLPVVGGLSVEFSNVKKAARIDSDAFVKICPTLRVRVAVIRQSFGRSSVNDGGGFVRAMKGFLEAAEEELKVMEEEQTRVMELVKRTTQFYRSGVSKAKAASPLQLFEIVKDFLDMVDHACVDIAQNQQKKVANVGSSSLANSSNQ
ncbi:hypothetical protein NE237_005662 [Protea cynaroides]|uniref:Formin-like protein n=1 Tax=Protea cynaroides TaxID=273540 RepID=A0A9Q0KKV1_9MAGN|nr:hypothetical protein NE237_005662 [Protea cynaroides]